MAERRVVMLFVDGVGMGGKDPSCNPLYAGHCPVLQSLLDKDAVPVDAGMGVPGIPQSATGTTAILTGINAAALAGRHVEGFPPESLKQVIRDHNIFTRLASTGLTSTFANAYFVHDVDEVVQRGRLQSVTTVAALAAFHSVRDRSFLDRDDAVYQDLTREGLRTRGYEGPLVTPEAAAGHLATLAGRYDFTLFEYFLTDRAGHSGDAASVGKVLSLFDRFLGTLLPLLKSGRILCVLVSDHGNIEDSRTRGHTMNPVPFAAIGDGGGELRRQVRSIVDVTPALLGWMKGDPGRGAVQGG